MMSHSIDGTDPLRASDLAQQIESTFAEAELFILDTAERFALDHPNEEDRVAWLKTLTPGRFVEAFSKELDDEAWTLIDDALLRAATALGYDHVDDDPRGSW